MCCCAVEFYACSTALQALVACAGCEATAALLCSWALLNLGCPVQLLGLIDTPPVMLPAFAHSIGQLDASRPATTVTAPAFAAVPRARSFSSSSDEVEVKAVVDVVGAASDDADSKYADNSDADVLAEAKEDAGDAAQADAAEDAQYIYFDAAFTRVPFPAPQPPLPLHAHGYWCGRASTVIDGVVQLNPEDHTAWVDTMVTLCLSIVTTPARVSVSDESVPAWWATLLNAACSCPRYCPAPSVQVFTPLCAAVIAGRRDVVTALLQAGASVDAHGCPSSDEAAPGFGGLDRCSPLMLALTQGSERIALDLLQAGANVDYVNPDSGAAALKYAFLTPSARKVESLAKYHESHTAAQGSTCSPLPSRCVHSLPAAAAESNTAIHAVTVRANSATVLRMFEAVLNSGADPNVSDAAGNFPLHWLGLGATVASRVKSVSVNLAALPDAHTADKLVRLLHARDAKLDAANRSGQTALHTALCHPGQVCLPACYRSLCVACPSDAFCFVVIFSRMLL